MDVVKYVFLALHLLSMAAIVGIWFANFRKPSIPTPQLIGACGTLLTGLILVGFAEAAAASGGHPVNHVKIAVKATLALIVLVSAIIGYLKQRKGQPVPTGLAHAVGGLALINVLVAAIWH